MRGTWRDVILMERRSEVVGAQDCPTLNYFTTRALDRLEKQRADEAWTAVRLQDEGTRFIPVWQDKNLFTSGRPEPVLLTPLDVQAFISTAESVILLGEDEDRTYFAIGLPAEGDAPPASLAALGQFRNLRQMAALLKEQDCALLTYAKSMAHWHHHQRFCGTCGSPAQSAVGGSMRVCTNAECARQHFPLIKPAVIVLVTAGDRCLLGRKPIWPEGLYSTLAGFVEPAESLEAAVVREVHEETSVVVTSMRYFASQPWPFPRSLMLGFTAQAVGEAIQVDKDELEDARWFGHQEIQEGLAQGSLRLPLKLAISFHLIENWFDREGYGPLREISTD
jgi:NAD+ diphosphatase